MRDIRRDIEINGSFGGVQEGGNNSLDLLMRDYKYYIIIEIMKMEMFEFDEVMS